MENEIDGLRGVVGDDVAIERMSFSFQGDRNRGFCTEDRTGAGRRFAFHETEGDGIELRLT
ncbi:hypothetical protein [Breoghania sp.]|uniref:hypothetical protein n=1 Tax=Breoghania sp. TaxID=2065378 RepID=UPI0026379836|nr:hypothetical protein [Breoghania sp.]MDJ0929793.1 hypothetical protein [Breoghania sp.]